MTRTVPSTEVSRHFSEYLNRVAYKGEHFLLVRRKQVLAELKPAPRGRRLGDLPELFRSLPHLSTHEAGELLKDIAAARAQLAKRRARDPWAS